MRRSARACRFSTQGWGIGGDAATSVFKYGIIGTKGWCLHGVEDVSVLALFFFMMVFMDTTATIPTGVDGRTLGVEELLHLWLVGCLALLPLRQLGLGRRLARSSWARTGTLVMGPSILPAPVSSMRWAASSGWPVPSSSDRVSENMWMASPEPIPGHNIPLAILGTFILAFGWFGFNPGSTLSGTDLRISAVVVNTMLASVTGAMATMFYLMVHRQEARSLDDAQRHARRLGGHHRAVCVCR